MRRHTTICAATFVISLCAACGSVPTPAVPDGRTRAPVNDQAKIDEYTARASREATQARDDVSTLRQIDALKRDIEDLKLYLAATAARQDGAPARASTRKSSTRSFVTDSRSPQGVAASSRESMEVREQSIVFRVAHGVAQSEFLPSPELQQVLLRAARTARLVEIRGRSDAAVASPASQRIALARAHKARQYLLKNGIAARKIRVSYLAAGGFIADNATPGGEARNRRVEIEAMDLPTDSFATPGKLAQGELQ